MEQSVIQRNVPNRDGHTLEASEIRQALLPRFVPLRKYHPLVWPERRPPCLDPPLQGPQQRVRPESSWSMADGGFARRDAEARSLVRYLRDRWWMVQAITLDATRLNGRTAARRPTSSKAAD